MTPPEEVPMTAALSLPALDSKQDWTVDDLASLPEDLRYELIDGRLILSSPTGPHQELGVEIVLALRLNCPDGFRPFTDLSLRVNQRNEPRPDVVVAGLERIHRSPIPAEDVLLAVEVISPDSHFRDMYAKARVYAAAGIAHYWVVDPMFDSGIVLTEYRRGEKGEYELISSTSKVFTTDVPYPTTIDLPALTIAREAMLAHTKPR
jgi:Uma2 family endonuclease